MLVIKRYPNRKLYDTETKKYITLDGISELIREGQEIQVLDHATGEDLTAVILTQIIFEQEKKQSGFLPRSVLTGLVQAGGDTLSSLRKTLASPLDMWGHVDEEIRRRVQSLISSGEIAEEEGASLLQKLLAQGSKAAGAISERILPSSEDLSARLSEMGVPTKADIEAINAQIEALEAVLDTVVKQQDGEEELTPKPKRPRRSSDKKEPPAGEESPVA